MPLSMGAGSDKQLLVVEQLFRAAESLLDTRPIFPQWDAAIQGHVFCSLPALALLDELQRRLAQRQVEDPEAQSPHGPRWSMPARNRAGGLTF